MDNAATSKGIDCRLVDVTELAELLGLSVRTCWREAAKARADLSRFPRPILIGERLKRWRLRDVAVYLDGLAGEGKPR